MTDALRPWTWDEAMQLLADGYRVQHVSERTGYPADELHRRARIRKVPIDEDEDARTGNAQDAAQ